MSSNGSHFDELILRVLLYAMSVILAIYGAIVAVGVMREKLPLWALLISATALLAAMYATWAEWSTYE